MFTLHDVLVGNQGKISVVGPREFEPEVVFHAAQHDSRQIEPGDLYVAIKGARVDGHSFLPMAMQAGATAALCVTPDTNLPAHFLQLVVPDTIKALQATARTRVQRQPDTIRIGITGTSGKTTTKEAIATVLARIAPTLKTYASYNNELGYPLTLLSLESEHRYAVLEMGAERVGELAWLCETIVPPQWSVITTVGSAHLQHFGSVEQVAIAKSELVQCLSTDGFAILNYDDPRVRVMAQKTRAQVVFYGLGEGATVRGSDLEGDGIYGRSFTLHIEDQQIRVQLHIPGEHGVSTALAAATVGHIAGVPLADIRDALESLTTTKGRGTIRSGPNGSTLIDDTYNAIRQSIIAITRTMQATHIPPDGKRWAVLGELLEQGEHSQHEHYASGEVLATTVDYLVVIGDNARFYVEGALHAGMLAENIHYFPVQIEDSAAIEQAKQAVVQMLKEKLRSSDLVLIKGSRGMRMETLFAMF